MMPEQLGHRDAADDLLKAIEHVLAHGPRTPDMGGRASTSDMGKGIAGVIEASM